jgi:transposase InsO family protein
VEHVRAEFGVPERFACHVLGQHRSTQRKNPRMPGDEAALTADIIALARQYGRYGYRRITALLREAGWLVNRKRVERIWRREGLKVFQKQPKRGRLWLNDGSCVRLLPEYPDHVWSHDFIEERTHNGRKFRLLNIIDEFTRECLAMRVNRKLNSVDVIDALSDLFILRGIPGHVRSDNGPGFIAQAVRDWIAAVGAKTAELPPSEWSIDYRSLDHEGEFGWLGGGISLRRSLGSCGRRRLCWRRAARFRMPVGGSGSRSRPTIAGARSMAV